MQPTSKALARSTERFREARTCPREPTRRRGSPWAGRGAAIRCRPRAADLERDVDDQRDRIISGPSLVGEVDAIAEHGFSCAAAWHSHGLVRRELAEGTQLRPDKVQVLAGRLAGAGCRQAIGQL